MPTAPTLDINVEVERIRDMYTKDLSQGTFNALVVGGVGAGKTHLLKTCRRPILIHSFDPKGTKTLLDEIKEGWVIPDTRFEHDDRKNPQAYITWERQIEAYAQSHFLEQVGTLALDSFTNFLAALIAHVCKQRGVRKENMEFKEWNIVVSTVRDLFKLITSLPCDFVCTAHIQRRVDEATGRAFVGIDATPKLQSQLPTLFDEIYYMEAKEIPGKGIIDRKLLTANTGIYEARTRLGRNGRFLLRETPDIKALLKKADMPTEDKPWTK